MYTFLIIVFHVYLGLLWRVHTREHGGGMLSLVLEFSKRTLFPGGCIPERESNWMCFVSRFTSDRLRREKDARPPSPCSLGEYKTRYRVHLVSRGVYSGMLWQMESNWTWFVSRFTVQCSWMYKDHLASEQNWRSTFPKEETNGKQLNVFCLLFYKLILMDISKSPCFQTKLEECIPERRDKWKVIECVLSLVLQVYPHG